MNIDPNQLLTVMKKEVHFWPLCQCEVCKVERTRQKPCPESHLMNVSVETAHTLGFIPSRCPEGSLAKKLACSAPK